MSARKPDAWLYSICGDYRLALTQEEVDEENLTKDAEERWSKPLYALSESDFEAIRRAADELSNLAVANWTFAQTAYAGYRSRLADHKADYDRVTALAAALRSIVEGKAG